MTSGPDGGGWPGADRWLRWAEGEDVERTVPIAAPDTAADTAPPAPPPVTPDAARPAAQITAPVILPRLAPTSAMRYRGIAVGVLAPLVLVLGAAAGTWPDVAATMLIVAVLAGGWPPMLDLPSPRGAIVVLFLGGTLAVVAMARTTSEPRLQWLALALAGAVVATFVHQLARRDGRPRLVESVAGEISGVVVLASLSTLQALPGTLPGVTGVLIWAGSVAAAAAVQALPLPARLLGPLGLVVGTAVGALVGGLAADGRLVAGAAVGALVSGVALMLRQLLGSLPAAGRSPGWWAAAVAPVAASGMVGYVALRLTLG